MRVNVVTPSEVIAYGISAKSVRNVIFWNVNRLKLLKEQAKLGLFTSEKNAEDCQWDIERHKRQITLLTATHDQLPGVQPFKKAH